ncbi:hypothetical protein B0H16DRAFT_1829744 [Mycena metata]|uniref:protein-tyrosine-phosphatase n=1 Tax=Mycena metata TaxID=1033252 RepID=A0AAD7NXU5_9AGAR|nr:hypothetical protein B0H16DRAFT_1829744 [Mycena metata]
MHQILPPTPLPPSSSHTHPSSSSPYAPYSSNAGPQQPRMSGALCLGSLTASNDHPLLRSHGITHLVQALEPSWAPCALASDGFSPFSVDIRDKETVLGRIWRGLQVRDGVSRSPSIIIAYLIRNHAMSYADALAFVKRRRAAPSPTLDLRAGWWNGSTWVIDRAGSRRRDLFQCRARASLCLSLGIIHSHPVLIASMPALISPSSIHHRRAHPSQYPSIRPSSVFYLSRPRREIARHLTIPVIAVAHPCAPFMHIIELPRAHWFRGSLYLSQHRQTPSPCAFIACTPHFWLLESSPLFPRMSGTAPRLRVVAPPDAGLVRASPEARAHLRVYGKLTYARLHRHSLFVDARAFALVPRAGFT